MVPDARSATLLGYTRRSTPVWQIAGAEGEGNEGNEGKDDIDKEAAKAALDVVGKMKEAGVEDPTSVLDLVKKLRAFEKGEKLPASIDKELKELRAKVEDGDGKSKSEVEKLTKQLGDLTKEIEATKSETRKRSVRASLLAAAAKAGAANPEDIPRLIDDDDVEVDDAGDVKNADRLVAALKRDRPAYFGKSSAGSYDGGARGGNTGGQPGMNDLLRSAARKGA